jgi:hypothetical protein
MGCKHTTHQAKSNESRTDSLDIINEKYWEITVNNGKGNPNAVYSLAATDNLMDNYLQNIAVIDEELAFSLSENKDYAKHLSADSLMIDSIGLWGDYTVYQVSNFYVMHRSILLKYADGKYRFLYTESDHNGSPQAGKPVFDTSNSNKALTKSEIAQLFHPAISAIDGEQILTVKYFIGGNKEYIGSYKFTMDKVTHLPKEIK